MASWEAFNEALERYRTSPEWSVVTEEEGLLILERQQ